MIYEILTTVKFGGDSGDRGQFSVSSVVLLIKRK